LVPTSSTVTNVPRIESVHDCEVHGFDILTPSNSCLPVMVHVHNSILPERIDPSIRIALVSNPDFLHHAALSSPEKEFSQHHCGLTPFHSFHQPLELICPVKFAAGLRGRQRPPIECVFDILQDLEHLLKTSLPVHEYVGWRYHVDPCPTASPVPLSCSVWHPCLTVVRHSACCTILTAMTAIGNLRTFPQEQGIECPVRHQAWHRDTRSFSDAANAS
jgi:hypothetical protein